MSTEIVRGIAPLRELLAERRRRNELIGFVPTMGALHDGHGRLIARARSECGAVVVSIFVNPIQFNQATDYERYPRTLETDAAFCDARGVDFIFAPDEREMYPEPLDTGIEVARLTRHLCGPFRPGHFRGVATVVAKLFLIVQPDRAYFGEKDAQQLAVIRRMVRDLDFPVEIVAVETVREPDGLALSSRNARLAPDEREAATVLYRALRAAALVVEQGERRAAEAIRAANVELERTPAIRVEYLEVVDADDMQPVEWVNRPVRIAVAAWAGDVRLIDNVLVS